MFFARIPRAARWSFGFSDDVTRVEMRVQNRSGVVSLGAKMALEGSLILVDLHVSFKVEWSCKGIQMLKSGSDWRRSFFLLTLEPLVAELANDVALITVRFLDVSGVAALQHQSSTHLTDDIVVGFDLMNCSDVAGEKSFVDEDAALLADHLFGIHVDSAGVESMFDLIWNLNFL
jgi:hypothetical protein